MGLSLQAEGYHGCSKRICTPLSGSFVVFRSAIPGLSLFALCLHAEGVRLHFFLACRTLTRAEVGPRLLAEVAREQDEDILDFSLFVGQCLVLQPRSSACMVVGMHHSHKGTCRTLTRAEVGLCLLAEVAWEQDEDLRSHLPLLLHASTVCLDSPEPTVASHALLAITHLLYSLSVRHLELARAGGTLSAALVLP